MKVFTALVFLAVLGLALAATATVSKDKEVNATVPSGSPQMPVPPQHARDARYYGYYGGYYPSYGIFFIPLYVCKKQ
ncbi:hypothetical protein Ocin01_12226 [Orchesella cincta]|uniref:Uncharacterized protein n=1 Tax=Orchesella cincta TaxID=48709 RepID=A0A1D2MMZ6_ORCCI|nr:hypothetical protein Ocin01_12226 [Orchesella cincta]